MRWAGVDDFEFPRLRSVTLRTNFPMVRVETRSGGGNRRDYEEEIQECRDHPNFVRDRDEEYDPTYMTFEYRISEENLREWEAYVRNQQTADDATLDMQTLFQDPERSPP